MAQFEYSDVGVDWRAVDEKKRDLINRHLADRGEAGWELIQYKIGRNPVDNSFVHHFIWRKS